MNRRRVIVLAGSLVVGVVSGLLLYRHFNRRETALDGPPGARTIHFPGTTPMGTVHVRDWGARGNWHYLGVAQGDMFIPAGKEVRLHVTRLVPEPTLWQRILQKLGITPKSKVPDAFPPLSVLAPNDIQAVLLTRTTSAKLDVSPLEKQTSLRMLNLSSNAVRDSDLAHIGRLPALTDLDLSRTRVGDAGLKHLAHMTSLRDLSLISTQVTDAGLKHLANLTSLRRLNLNDTTITDAGLAHLKGLRSLELLSLSGTQIGEAGLAHVKGLTSLKTLRLTETQVTDAGLIHLRQLVSLEELEVAGTRITGKGLAPLMRAFPNCHILR